MKDFTAVKWIRRSIGKRDAEGVALILLNTLIAICTTLFAMISKYVIDAAERQDIASLKKNVMILLFAITTQMVARILASFLETISQGKCEICIRTTVFKNILSGNFAKMGEYHSGELMTRLTADTELVAESAIHIVPTAVLNIMKSASAGIALLSLDRTFAIIFIVCGILLAIATLILRGPIKKYHRRAKEKEGKLRSFMQESIENLFAVKVFHIESKMVNRSKKRQDALFKAKVQKRAISIFAELGFSLAFAFGFLAAVAYGASGVVKGTMTFGTVTSLILLVNQLQSPISGLTGVIPSFFSMVASATRLMEVSEATEKEEASENISYDEFLGVEAKNLTFSYDGEAVINDADFNIRKGDFVGIKGRSGAGKTTIFKLITGLYKADSGEICAITTGGKKDASSIRGLITLVPQDNMLFSGTIRENITLLNKKATDEEIENALNISCANEFVKALPNGLETYLGEDGSGISQGQAQRLAIARAILSGKKVLLMDEATASLDAETEKKFIENLKNASGITVIFITHREAVLSACNVVLEVSNGEVKNK